MKNKTISYILGYIIGFVLFTGVSWIATCGIYKLITLCFDTTYSWSMATGVWLCLCLLGSVFGGRK